MRVGCRDAQTLLHDGTGGGVLQELPLLGEEMMLDGKCGERSLVKAAQDELLLAGIGVDVADREDAGDAGLKPLRIHLERPLLEFHAPVGDGTQFRMQPVKGEHVLGGQCDVPSSAVCTSSPVSLSLSLRRPVVLPSNTCILPALTNSRIRATVAGAARNSARRCSSVSERALSHSATVQSRAESPPPQITRSRP